MSDCKKILVSVSEATNDELGFYSKQLRISKNELIAALIDVFGELVLAPEIAVYLGNEKLTDTMSDAVRVKIGERQNVRWRSKGNAYV